VHEVVGDVDVLTRATQRVRVEHVALVQIEALVGEVSRPFAVAHEAADLVAACGEQGGQLAADESRGSGDEGAHVSCT
jgi:hypothetical protein